MDLEPLDGSQVAGVDADASQGDVTPHAIAVGDPPVDRDRRLAQRPLVPEKILLEFGMGAGCRAGGAVTYERLGNQFVDGAEITLTPATVQPAPDHGDRIDRDLLVLAHGGSIAERDVGWTSGPSTRVIR